MEGTIGEIRMFGGNFGPKFWTICRSQILSIASNTALFSILGTTYGGNGQSTFGLPDFRSRIPVGMGQGPGLSYYSLGESAGNETKTITNANFPAHTHPLSGTITMPATAVPGTADVSQGNYPATLDGTDMYSTTNNGSSLANMNTALTASPVGGSIPVNNIQPVLGVNFIICMQGIFPARN